MPDAEKQLIENIQGIIELGKEEQFLQLAIKTHLAPLIHKNLKGAKNISEEFSSTLGNIRNQVLVRNVRLYRAFDQVLQLFNQESILVIPLKGIYSAENLYYDMSVRHLSDIDVLIKREDLPRICKLMHDRKWNIVKPIPHSQLEAETFEPAHPCTLVKDGILIELHTHLYNRGSAIEISEEGLWRRTHQEKFRKGVIHQFEKPMLLQHWCLHLFKHLKGDELKLVSFVDIHLLLKSMSSIEMDSFWKLCETYGCTDICSSILKICSSYWGVEVPSIPKLDKRMHDELNTSFLQFVYSPVLNHRLNNRLDKVWAQSMSIEDSVKRIEFMIRYLFPNVAFMRKHYRLNTSAWLLPWYLYRLAELSFKIMKLLTIKLKAKQTR